MHKRLLTLFKLLNESDDKITCKTLSNHLKVSERTIRNDITSINVATNENCLSDQFLNLYIDINDLIVSPCRDHYITLFEDILAVGEFLGFSEDVINEKFKLKN